MVNESLVADDGIPELAASASQSVGTKLLSLPRHPWHLIIRSNYHGPESIPSTY
ncbi:hypothetical protein CY34DRAFT_804229 [Suillus luteus UH-Slu-Lm8-n1]|uniref:Uncharacterized protein n=1 Tax=Suillus luteus UH-Slu-Lm8-n1 TaxID=930992 RepID=A0A0D0AMM9_9AGAM|nr:hypothetical protein CY34DRAFT_804229 [Suillus luteus UH-Slu-Lm8-n1]